jgi:hypothetical protein
MERRTFEATVVTLISFTAAAVCLSLILAEL